MVVGNLYIKDLNLDLSYMEIIDLSPDDFKSTPQLRDCLRNKQIEAYLQNRHPHAKKFRFRNSKAVEKEIPKSNNDFSDISKSLIESTNRLSKSLDRIDLIISSHVEPRVKKEDSSLIDNLLSKMDILINTIEKNKDSSKFDLILKKLDNNYAPNRISSNFTEKEEKHYKFDDVPIYVPEINLGNISNKSIKSQEESSEGTGDILEKLKKLKQEKKI